MNSHKEFDNFQIKIHTTKATKKNRWSLLYDRCTFLTSKKITAGETPAVIFLPLCIKRAKIAHAFDEVKRNETNHQTLGNRIAHWLPVDFAVWQSLSGRKNSL